MYSDEWFSNNAIPFFYFTRVVLYPGQNPGIIMISFGFTFLVFNVLLNILISVLISRVLDASAPSVAFLKRLLFFFFCKREFDHETILFDGLASLVII